MNDAHFNIISKDKNSITVEMINYDNTLLRPLVEEISRDDSVDEIHYYIKHPNLDNPQIHVKVKSGKPQSAIKKSIRRIDRIYNSLIDDLEREEKRLNVSK
ncbi:DNA-directed RNA polymerase subunit L [Picrophilus oshimae]|uniref:DNA-directed RNA polymerase subunit Rpo11 n=2 Tax=Picrophilus torridus (strain ATCC 700027 / DSM 9790 / JCM 10055 / NBRC 100828 / KAW 2/3) TaxID=1122961 RepID=RPO11_PICTO|nr:DNA-directed RNA polymerase subunit L [Picrophilus oshimae]Q6L204.1 RecName: Full=DNA-directed RNA polymerase subunit Rpo11; AltName: Full=DNA-directed RNA polymerase subunit L [Picrophilus oshimae DSM 9789]AAT42998.1 DNA-directed RNA polymerase subunit L [Picrophilus oshimae DSM 9789]SMD30700.1 DNA-directed RNA polymerase, subunit L [Picrophilus oshimae DSM 9789]